MIPWSPEMVGLATHLRKVFLSQVATAVKGQIDARGCRLPHSKPDCIGGNFAPRGFPTARLSCEALRDNAADDPLLLADMAGEDGWLTIRAAAVIPMLDAHSDDPTEAAGQVGEDKRKAELCLEHERPAE